MEEEGISTIKNPNLSFRGRRQESSRGDRGDRPRRGGRNFERGTFRRRGRVNNSNLNQISYRERISMTDEEEEREGM